MHILAYIFLKGETRMYPHECVQLYTYIRHMYIYLARWSVNRGLTKGPDACACVRVCTHFQTHHTTSDVLEEIRIHEQEL